MLVTIVYQEVTNRLETLNLNGNSISGTIPSEIGNSTLLQILRLQDNRISGDLPTQLQNLQFLEVLNIGQNNFAGLIPTFIGLSMPRLQLINLYESGFIGTISDSLCDDGSTNVTLEHNDVSGNKVMIVSCNTAALCNCCAAQDLSNPLNNRFQYYEAPIKVECAEDLLNL